MAAIFPEGTFLSRRWRVATWIAVPLVLVPTVLGALIPDLLVYRGFENPVGIDAAWLTDAAEASITLMLPILIIGSASTIIRFRRARGDERQQLKWLVLSISFVAALIIFYGIVAITLSQGANPRGLEWAEWAMIVAFVSVPVSIAFGVLKYRLYDIDVVINKAVVYGAIAIFITVVYVGVVVGVGAAVGSQGDVVLSALAAAIVALAFQPARRWAQRIANRIVYGERATPYEVLAQLGDRLAGEYASDDVLDRVASTLAGGRRRRARRRLAPRRLRAPAGGRVARRRRHAAHGRRRRATRSRPRSSGCARSPSVTRASCSARSRWRSRPPIR